MGVDFFPCANPMCGDTCCDCGGYVECECSRKWCSEKCAKEEGYGYHDEDDIHSCSYCRNEEAEDFSLFYFLLRKYNVTRDQVLKEYLDDIRNRKDEPETDAD